MILWLRCKSKEALLHENSPVLHAGRLFKGQTLGTVLCHPPLLVPSFLPERLR